MSPFDQKAYMKKWREDNREHVREYMREYDKKRSPRDLTEYQRGYYLKNRERIRARHREYDKNLREERLIRCKKRVSVKGERITLSYNPRKNICLRCGNTYPEDLIRQTTMHHIAYHPQFPLSATLELCNTCHRRLHNRNKRNPLPPLKYFY